MSQLQDIAGQLRSDAQALEAARGMLVSVNVGLTGRIGAVHAFAGGTQSARTIIAGMQTTKAYLTSADQRLARDVLALRNYANRLAG